MVATYWVPSPASAWPGQQYRRSVVSGIVRWPHPVLPAMDTVGCLIRPLHSTPSPLLWPPPQIGTLHRVWHDCHRNSSGVARCGAELIVGLIGWVAKAMRRSGHPRVCPPDFTIPDSSAPYHAVPYNTIPYHTISYLWNIKPYHIILIA